MDALRAHAGRQVDEATEAGKTYADQGLVFCDEIGDPLGFEVVAGASRSHVEAAELPRITLHGLRHTFATVALHDYPCQHPPPAREAKQPGELRARLCVSAARSVSEDRALQSADGDWLPGR